MTRRRDWSHVALPLVIVAIAALLRGWQLETIPLGLHGDEAITGMDARHALAAGWIGPYLYPSALGQPAGPVYLTALLFRYLPQSTATLRGSIALFGVAAVFFTYLAARAMCGRRVGLVAAALLAVLPWHLHLSRTAFMVNAWPAVEMAALWLLFVARRRAGRARTALVAALGAVAGLGIYSYNAFVLCVPLLATPFLYDWLGGRGAGRRAAVGAAAIAGLAALLVALPMLDYVRTHEEFFWHQEEVGVVHTAAWQDADWSTRAGMLAGRSAEWSRGVVLGGRRDDGDGLADRGYPLLDPLTALLALAGIGLALRGWRRPAHGVLLVALLTVPWGALLTIEDGLYRRTYGLAPLLCMLAALPVAALWRRAATPSAPRTAVRISLAGLAVLLAGSAARNAYRYFVPLQDTEQMRYVFPYQVDAASRFIAALPADRVVYWFSERWPASYETRRWFAPDANVIEQSPEFDAAPSEVAPDVVMLLGDYRKRADDWEQRYPGGHWESAQRGDEVLFRAYVLRRGESPRHQDGEPNTKADTDH
ncbi:MAG: glycosyltransferase family 39 protein [bacterium]